MSQYTETNCGTVTCGAAIPQYARVVLGSGGTVTAAGATVKMHGTLEEESFASGDVRVMRFANAVGTRKMIASEAITRGAPVFAAADGEVAADGDVLEGFAMEAATADQDIIEVLTLSANGTSGGILNAAQQTLAAGGGAVNVTSFYTAGASDAGGDAWTLADGTFPGQLKKIKLITDGGGDAVLTPTNFSNGTTITFADAGDYALLLWDGDEWTAVEVGNDADGATAPVIA